MKKLMKKTKRRQKWNKIENKKYAGIHLIAEFWCERVSEDKKELEKILLEAAEKAKNTPLKFLFHKFQPHGFSGVLLLGESHISLHFWPELNYLAIDIFTCGAKTNPSKALEYLKKKFKPKKVTIKIIKRGKIS